MEFQLRWTVAEETYTCPLSHQKPLTIGRDPSCDLSLQIQSVSRHHAEVFARQLDSVRYYIRNTSSINPILFHDTQQVLNENDLAELRPGYHFQVGTVVINMVNLGGHHRAEVQCTHCGRFTHAYAFDCPWCGMNLAFGKYIS